MLGIRNAAVRTDIQRDGKDLELPAEDGKLRTIKNQDSLSFLEDFYNRASWGFIDFLQKISARSVRRELQMWEWTLSSKSLLENHLSSRSLGKTSLVEVGLYSLFDGLLTGKYPVHHRNEHPVANLFYIVDDVTSERDILIGAHLLHLLRKGCRSYTEAWENLRPLGYREEQVRIAFGNFKSRYFFEIVSIDSHTPFVLHDGVVDAHDQLLRQPAYADNMAMVTPVSVSRSQDMVVTNSYTPALFAKRVHTTMQFFRELMVSEQRFCQPDPTHLLISEGEFQRKLSDLRVPSVFKIMALSYQKRLAALRKGGYLKGILQESDWERVLRDDLFVVAQECSDHLVAITAAGAAG